MEDGRKKLRICLTCVVVAAIVIGIFYYYYGTSGSETVSEGALITATKVVIPWR